VVIWIELKIVCSTGIMFAASLRSSLARQGHSMARSFSNTAGLAAEVKKLGVVGAGQMVSFNTLTAMDST
jgi:hypothetical protein